VSTGERKQLRKEGKGWV